MANPYINKVVLGNETLLDLTVDTATAADVASGKYFHLATGERVQGTASGAAGGTIAVDSASMVGSVETGTAVTAAPNYTPSGDIRLVTQPVQIVDTAALNTSYSNYVLTISGVTTTSHAVAVPSDATFVGSPVKLVVESEEQ